MSSTGTLENDPQPESAEAAHAHDAAPGETHDHEGAHEHGPVLNPECTREIEIDVPAEDVSKAFRASTRNYQRLARIPGFRPGKVPETVIRRRFADEIRKEVIDQLLPDRFNQAVRDLGVTPVGQPHVSELSVEDGAPIHVKAAFEFIPDFSIDDYQNVTVPKPPVEVTDEELAHELEQLRQSRATIEPVEEDRALVDGDWAQISYNGRLEGDPDAPPVTGEDVLVEVGGGDTLPAFTEALRGSRPGQELKAEVLYPADYSDPKLAGKTGSFDIDVKAIKKRTVPDLDDDFARELGEYANLAELETRVREHMTGRKRRSVENETKDRLFAALIDRYPFAVPESLVQDRIDGRLDRGLRALAAQGMSTANMRKLDFGRLRTAQRDGAIAEVKTSILLDRIAGAEGVTISDEEMDHELQMLAYQTRESVEALRSRLTADGGMARIREQLKREKTANLLYGRLPG
ncbi:MAG TPA: trigger factor [Terracidiphilus sp.]|nr:trigger factor [Terracidiphilus sp.]